MSAHLGQAFAYALARKDGDKLKTLLQPTIDFRAMTPRQFWESNDSTDVVDNILFGKWLEPSDDVQDVVAIDNSAVGPRHRVGYRLRVTNPDGTFLVEQQAYFEAEGDTITWLRIMCAGFVAEA